MDQCSRAALLDGGVGGMRLGILTAVWFVMHEAKGEVCACGVCGGGLVV